MVFPVSETAGDRVPGECGIAFDEQAADEQRAALLADFYAQRALTRQPVHPDDCAEATLFLAGPALTAAPATSSLSTAA